MPTYDYKCLDCQFDFEYFQSMSDEPLKNCPKCNGKVKRLIGAGAGPIFKGSGFYQTDYKNSSPQKTSSPTNQSSDKISSVPVSNNNTKKV